MLPPADGRSSSKVWPSRRQVAPPLLTSCPYYCAQHFPATGTDDILKQLLKVDVSYFWYCIVSDLGIASGGWPRCCVGTILSACGGAEDGGSRCGSPTVRKHSHSQKLLNSNTEKLKHTQTLATHEKLKHKNWPETNKQTEQKL